MSSPSSSLGHSLTFSRQGREGTCGYHMICKLIMKNRVEFIYPLEIGKTYKEHDCNRFLQTDKLNLNGLTKNVCTLNGYHKIILWNYIYYLCDQQINKSCKDKKLGCCSPILLQQVSDLIDKFGGQCPLELGERSEERIKCPFEEDRILTAVISDTFEQVRHVERHLNIKHIEFIILNEPSEQKTIQDIIREILHLQFYIGIRLLSVKPNDAGEHVGHVVTIVGIDKNGHLMIKNSWGENDVIKIIFDISTTLSLTNQATLSIKTYKMDEFVFYLPVTKETKFIDRWENPTIDMDNFQKWKDVMKQKKLEAFKINSSFKLHSLLMINSLSLFHKNIKRVASYVPTIAYQVGELARSASQLARGAEKQKLVDVIAATEFAYNKANNIAEGAEKVAKFLLDLFKDTPTAKTILDVSEKVSYLAAAIANLAYVTELAHLTDVAAAVDNDASRYIDNLADVAAAVDKEWFVDAVILDLEKSSFKEVLIHFAKIIKRAKLAEPSSSSSSSADVDMKVAKVAVDVAIVADELLAKVNFDDKKYENLLDTTKVLVGKALVAKLFRLFVATQVGEFADKLVNCVLYCNHMTQRSVTKAIIKCREAALWKADVYMVADNVDKVAGKVFDCVSAEVELLSAEVQTVINMVAAEVAARKKTTTESTSSDVEVIDVVDDSDDDVEIIGVKPAPTDAAPTAAAPTAKPVTHKKRTKGGCKKKDLQKRSKKTYSEKKQAVTCL